MAGQLATAVKLFPGLLLVYFLLRGRWKALAAGVATFAAATALAAVVLGPSPCADHLFQVLPGAADVGKGSWPNASATGLWAKLFDTHGDFNQPLWVNPTFAGRLCLPGMVPRAGRAAQLFSAGLPCPL